MSITVTDIKVLPVQVKMEAYDLCLDCMDPERKKADPNGQRRALVHDFNDGLTINWDQDYPGGVTVQGVVTIPHRLDVAGFVEIKGNTTLFGEVRLENKLEVRKLLVNTTTTVMGPQHVPIPVTVQIDVGSEIAALKKKVSELEQQVASHPG